MKTEIKAKKLAARADWTRWGNATIEDFPENIRAAFRRFAKHADEATSRGTSSEYSRSLGDIEERMAMWLGSPCDISWEGDPNSTEALFSAMRRNVEAFIEENKAWPQRKG